MVRKKKFLLLGLGISLLFVVIYSSMDDGDGTPKFRTEQVTRGDIRSIVSATGTINPVQLVSIGSQVSGQVSKLYVQVNDKVKAGQLLAEIDPALLLAQIKQDKSTLDTARSNFEQAQRDVARMKMLVSKDYVAKVDLERAQQSLLSTKNSYEVAQTIIERDMVNLAYAKITSPIDGVIISQDVTEGQTLQASFQAPTLFKIAGNLSEMKIEVNLSEADISKVKEGMHVTFQVNAFPEKMFQGKVHQVNVSPNSNNSRDVVTYGVKVLVDNKDGMLLPGMTAYVSITLSELKDILRIPASALRFRPPATTTSPMGLSRLFSSAVKPQAPATPVVEDPKTKTIYVLRGEDLEPVEVDIDGADDAYLAVSGKTLKEGDNVVTGIQRNQGKG
jgi:HlyD family secretion protein